MEFFCHNPAAKYACDQIWKGRVKNLTRKGNILEADVEGKGSAMHVIIGTCQYGGYLCIPSWGIGSELAGLEDCFWNRERLERYLSTADAITITEALRAISKELENMV